MIQPLQRFLELLPFIFITAILYNCKDSA